MALGWCYQPAPQFSICNAFEMSGAGWKRGPCASIIPRCRMTMHTSEDAELWRRLRALLAPETNHGASYAPSRRRLTTRSIDPIQKGGWQRGRYRHIDRFRCGYVGKGDALTVGRAVASTRTASHLKAANTRDVANCRPKHKHSPSGNSLDRSERLRSGALLPPCSDFKRTAAFGSSSRDRLRLRGGAKLSVA